MTNPDSEASKSAWTQNRPAETSPIDGGMSPGFGDASSAVPGSQIPNTQVGSGPLHGKTQDTNQDLMKDISQNKLAVLGVMFGVTGFLGLPLLWINRKFSNVERVGWSIVNIFYTCTLIYIAYRICIWSYNRVMGI